MVNLSRETPRLSIDVLSQAVKDLVQNPALATKGSALGAITQIKQLTDESFEKASRMLGNLVAGTTRFNPQNLLTQPEALTVAGLAVTALAYAKFGPVGAGAVALLALAAGCNSDPPTLNYVDEDGDNFDVRTDCDDSDPEINPQANEICDGIDNDCDELVDDSDSNVVGTSTWYADEDSDGYGNPDISTKACTQPDDYPDDYVDNSDDCDDDDETVHENLPYYIDGDEDGYGSDVIQEFCKNTAPEGYSENSDDCNDLSAEANPGITEETFCDELDNECDGYIDNESATNTDCLSNVGSRTEGIKFQGDVGSLAGSAVSGGLDLDGDGNEDLLIGAQAMNAPAPYPNTGGVYAFYGPFSTMDPTTLSSIGIALAGEYENDFAGTALSPVGNVDGVVGDDFLVGAYGNDTNAENAGVAYVITGGSLPSSSAANPHEIINYAYAVLLGQDANNNVGYSVASNGNGSVVVGAPGASLVYLASGINTGTQNIEDIYDLKLEGEGSSDRAGTTLSMGILDGDGNRNDLLVGAYRYGGETGVVYVCQDVDTLSGSVSLSTTCFEIFGLSDGDQLGGSNISWDGDVDNNGYGDILVGSVPTGAAYLFLGDSVKNEVNSGTSSLTLSDADAQFIAENSGSNVSSALAIGGLEDGDDFDEMMIGANSDDTVGNSSGAAYLFYGDPSNFSGGATHMLPTDADLTLLGESQDDAAGYSAAFVGNNLLIGARSESSNGTDAGAAYLLLGSGL